MSENLENILTKVDGEQVIDAIVGALEEVNNSKYANVDISEELSNISENYEGKSIIGSVAEALSKMAEGANATYTDIRVVTEEEYRSYKNHDDCFYAIADNSKSYVMKLSPNNKPSGEIYEVSSMRDTQRFLYDREDTGMYAVTLGANMDENYIRETLYQGLNDLYSIYIPEGFVSIQDGSFDHCSIYEVSIPDTMTSIGDFAFSNSPNLTAIRIPSSVNTIGENAFYNCTNLTTIKLAKVEDSIEGSPWGATNATIVWGVL